MKKERKEKAAYYYTAFSFYLVLYRNGISFLFAFVLLKYLLQKITTPVPRRSFTS